MTVVVEGVGALSAFGLGAGRLLDGLLGGATAVRADGPLSRAFPGAMAAELDELPPPGDRQEAKARKLMSRSAALAVPAAREALTGAGWRGAGEEVGFFMGVGASAVDLDEVAALLGAGQTGQRFDERAFGEHGMAAAHPLLSFQLMNNFSLCHTAILEGLRGPSVALFSRGAGTTQALEEALASLREGECQRALVGGADAVHPATWAERVRGGATQRGEVPGEGAAFLALRRVDEPGPPARILVEDPLLLEEASELASAAHRLRNTPPFVFLTAGDPGLRGRWAAAAAAQFQGSHIVDVAAAVGDTLAAAPALGWAAAAAFAAREGRHSVCLHIDGEGGASLVSLGSAE